MSMAPLLGLPGKVKTLIDRLTSTRASNLDNLNATVSSRAPASTALSSATWSNGRAANLDNLDSPVSGLASQSSVDDIPTTAIQSIQEGTGLNTDPSGEVNVTISAVDVSKSVVIIPGFMEDTFNYTKGGRLTSSTNLLIETRNQQYYWQVVEFK